MDDKVKTIREFVLNEFLIGESPDELTDSTELITSGILDSLATLKLVAFIEELYGIEVEAHEVSVDNMNTINDIAKLVCSKL